MNADSQRYYCSNGIALLAPRAALPWTICVLFYGDHADLCRRFLESLYRFTDPAAFHLRAGMNAVGEETARLLREAAERYGNIKLYSSGQNLFKLPMMRRMFHDPPPETDWTIWFDDDSHVTSPHWIMDLALAMEQAQDVELFGSLHAVDVSDHVEQFITSAEWYREVPRRTWQDGRRMIIFPVGGFWVVRTVRLAQTNWPDVRLDHFEDDYLMGEAMRQQGVRLAHFESGVAISDAPRRAPAEVPWALALDHPP
jgi:Glycosyltransferase like family 2